MPNKINVDEDYFLLEAVKAGKESQVRSILSNSCYRNIDYVDCRGRTALHWATEYGYKNIIRLLLDSKWSPDLPDNKGQTPLHIACNHHKTDIATWLIRLGCDVNAKDDVGNAVLQRAIHNNLESVVHLLCKLDVGVNAKNKNDWSPLHEAIRIGNKDIVRLLISKGADVNALTQYKATPFSTAIFYYRIAQKNSYSALDPIGRTLVLNGGRLSQSDGQWSPLLSCISIGNSYIAGMLLYHGCRVDDHGQYGRSLLVDAFTRCDTNVVKLLVTCGYRLTIEEVEQCTRRIPTFSRSFRRLAFSGHATGTNGVKMIVWLRERVHNCFSLQELARMTIRKSLNVGSGDRSILDNIQKLVLPRVIKEYISIDEIENVY
ncbi:serine/threonine-protein phosphatase 6 regulatory ankyrin repeat subunit B-like [Argopecten irradians]|uniref:serine/threonine-protein phosphatase 6 regulatory ankyrin repeat subunit B-like n=1 Tax=Argopecten irradians TaxID=31199 RepID=UPI003720C00D